MVPSEAKSQTRCLISLRWTWPAFLYRVYSDLFRSFRIEILLPDGRRVSPREYRFAPVIFAHSERDDLVLAGFPRYTHFTMLVTHGKDGDWATQALESIGVDVVRGSTLKRGSQALMRLIRALQADAYPASICVDGPLGPVGGVKSGILLCAQYANRLIIPLGTAARPSLVFRKTWSQTYLPLPFAKVVVVCGEPLCVPKEADREVIQHLAVELSLRLANARHCAELRLKER